MKIVVLLNSRDLPGLSVSPCVVAGADSALLRPSEPVFLPAGGSAWTARIAPAVRIGRLGTHIPVSAAHAYVDAHTLMHLLMPPEHLYDAVIWGLSDRSFSPGRWIDGCFGTDTEWSASAAPLYGGGTVGVIPTREVPPQAVCDAAIAAVSRFATLKTGDIIIFGDYAADLPLEPNLLINANLGDSMVLNLKIK